MNLAPRTVSRIINEDLGLRAFKRRTGHLITPALRDIRRVGSKMLLARHDGRWHERILFTDENIFTVEEKINRQNDKMYARSSLEFSSRERKSEDLKKSQHPSSVMVWWGVSYQGVTDLHFCAKGPRIKQRLYFDQVSEFDRGRIVAYPVCGLSFREIGSRVGRNKTIVMRICDRWIQEGTTDRRVLSHPPQCTTSRADRQIGRLAEIDRSVTSRP
ncbi:WNT5B [Cordylochernes scorpioides]|uniref:WNT5B n=1 Tax=Cordylochernes scorpioides TaxID=51811 RepID=A0ABY6KD30_9ARAC|nr:WNT5B [Cordylochernes scorpioides]